MAVPGYSGAQEEALTKLQEPEHLFRCGRLKQDICLPCDWSATVLRTSGAAVTAPAVALELTSPTQALGGTHSGAGSCCYQALPPSQVGQVKHPQMNWQLREKRNSTQQARSNMGKRKGYPNITVIKHFV